jgi:hypothetical protein
MARVLDAQGMKTTGRGFFGSRTSMTLMPFE